MNSRLLIYCVFLLIGFSQPIMAATFGWEVEGSFSEGGSSVPSIKVSPAVPLSYGTGFCVNAYTVEEQLSFSYYAMASGKPNSDFNQSSDFAGTYCVGPGQSSVSLTGITAINDGVTEGTEDIYVCIQTWDDSEFGANGDFIRPVDEDEADTGNGYPYCWLADITETVPPTVDFNVTSSSGAESVSSAALQVDLSAQSTSAVTVDYAVTGTATGGGTDYTLANGTLTIPANTSSANITIGSIVDDNLYEGNETVIVTLSNPSGATLGTDTVHTYTINENDTLPSLTIADISSAEGALGANSQPNVRVSLSHPSTQSISFQWETQDGTATSADTDYGVETGATLYISAGDMFVDIPPVIFGDDAFENDENFSILLTNAVNATIADNTGIVTITNDDSAPSLSVSLLGNAIEGNGNALIRIEPSTVAGVPITFDYTTSDGTASAGVEYSLTAGTATINAGAPDISIPVPMLDNSVDNSDKNFTFTISNSSNATIAVSSTMVSIIDDEATISINDITVSESANTATLTVTVQGPMMAANLDVDYATANGTATAGTDYTLNSGTISFSSANSPPFGVSETETITISLSDDAIIEGSEYFEVNLSNIVTTGSVVISDGVGRITITDNDAATVDFNVTSSSGAESVSSAALQVDLSAQSTSAVTVDYAVTGTATGGGTDYTLANGTLTIPANTSSATITIGSIVDDTLVEGSETVIVTLSNPSGATLGTDIVHTYTITDNDAATVDFNVTSSSGAESVSSAALQVDLSAQSTSAVTVDYAVTGTATGGGTDYTLANGTLTIPANTSSANITIGSIVDDNLYEGNETVIVTLSNPSGATLGTDTVHTYTITDNDAATVDFNVTSSSGAESVSSAALQVDLSAQSTSAVTVDYAVTGTATGGGTDYTLANGTLTIPANTSSATITIGSIVDDTLVEGSETVIVTLSNPSGATLGTDIVHTYTITDNDAATVDFNVTSSSGAESVSSAALQVDLSAQSTSAVTVDYAVTGTATGGGTDYTLANGTLTIPANTSSATITIGSIVDDTLVEGSETVIVTLSNPSGATLGTDIVHTYTITDNDAATVDFNVTSSSGAESVSSAALQVDLSAQSTSAVTVDYAVTGTATGGGTDYTLANGTLTIPANTSSATITIGSIVDDTLVEGSETVIVTLSNPSGATLGTDTVHTYTITDNDAAPTVSISGTASLSEAVGSQSFSVSLNSPATTIYTIDYNTSDNTATSPTDYSSNSGTLSFAIGEITKTITVNIVDDDTQEGNEIFFIQLSNPTGGVSIGVSSLTVMISDDDNGVSNAELDAAENFVTSISDKLAEEKGGDLIEASHRLIRASLDNLILRSNISASATSEQNTANGFLREVTREERRRNFFETSSTKTEETEINLLRKVAGGINNVMVDADDFGHKLNFDYDHIMPLIKTDKRLISKFSIQSSKQKDGPAARRLIASAAIEKDVDDKASVLGRFVHITNENADFNTDYVGEKKSNSVNLGIYKVYSPDVNALKSMYISAGIADTDLQLKKSGMLLESSYLSYLFQGGIAAGKVYKNKNFNSILEFSLDALYDYQTGHQLDITSGISKFSRVLDGKERYEFIGRFEPKLNYKIESESRRVTVLQFTPLLKCGVGSMDPDCGGGFGTKISTSLGQRSDHFSIGLRYENYRDTDFWEYTMNSNQSLYKRENLRLITNLKIEERLFEASKRTNPYSINSEIRMKF